MKYLMPMGFFLFTFFLQLSLISIGPFHPDICLLVHQSQRTLETGQLQPYLTGYNIPVLVGAFFIYLGKFFGISSEIAVNFIGVLFGALCVPVFFLLCRNFFNEGTAIFATIGFINFPLFLSLSTVGSVQIVALFFLLLGIKLLNDYGGLVAQKKESFLYLIGAICILACAAASRPQELFFMVIPISLLYWMAVDKKHQFHEFLIRLCVFWVVVLLLTFLIPLPFLFHNRPFDWSAVKSLYLVAGAKHNSWPIFLRMLDFGVHVCVDQLSSIGILMSCFGIFLLWKKNTMLFILFILWILIAFGAYVNLFYEINPAERYLLIIFPPLLMLLGYAFFSLINGKKWWFRSLGIGVFILLQFMFLNRILPVLKFRHQHSVGISFAKWVEKKTAPDDLILAEDEQAFIMYYGNRKTFYFVQIFADKELNPVQKFDAVFNEVSARHSQVYIILNKEDFLKDFFKNPAIKDRYSLVLIGEYPFEWWQDTATMVAVYPDQLYKIEKRL